jgi:hypothetical protein
MSYVYQSPFCQFVFNAYRIALLVFCGVYTRARRSRGHSLISVLAEVELLLVLIVMHALDHLRPDERCLCDDALQGHHMVELVGAECAWVAGVFTEAANVGTVVNDIGSGLGFGAVGEGFDNALEGTVECLYEFEGLVKEPVGQLSVV